MDATKKYPTCFCPRQGAPYELCDILACAKNIVDGAILDAVEEFGKTDDAAPADDDSPAREATVEDEDDQSDWPTSGKMSIDDGLNCVRKMMTEWKTEQAMHGWKFYAQFIGLESDGTSDFYNYQVRWSVPTAAYPEPRVTVNVFFLVKAARKVNLKAPVEVTYNLEGNQFAHCSKMPFRPKWMYDALDTKTMIFKSFKF